VGAEYDQGLALDDTGAIHATTDLPPARFYYGLPFDANDRLVVEDATPTYYDQGLGFTANNALAGHPDMTPGHYNQGVYIDGDGALWMDGLTPALVPPNQVQNLVLTIPVDNQIQATWSANIPPPTVASYTVQYREVGAGVWNDLSAGLATTLAIPGLTAGVDYEVQVYASNAAGDGPPSTIETQVVEGLPTQVTGLALLTPTDNEIDASWNAVTPAAPAITSYTVEYKETTSGTWIPQSAGLSLSDTITGLTGGIQYDVRVFAVNSKGNGPPSTIEMATPTGVPAAPDNFIATPLPEAMELDWDLPAANPALTGLELELKLNTDTLWSSWTLTVAQIEAVIYSLDVSLYNFRVRGINSIGEGAWSTINATPLAISATKQVEYDETGVDTGSPINFVNNTGAAGAAFNLDTFINQANITPITHKTRAAFTSSGTARLGPASTPPAQGQQGYWAWCGNPSLIDGNNRFMWVSAFQVNQVTASSSNTLLTSSGSVNGAAMSASGNEWIVFGVYDGANSRIRVIENGGIDTNVAGSIGLSDLRPEFFFWDFGQSGGQDFQGDQYAFRFWNSVPPSAAEEESIINSLKQDWFTGVQDIIPPAPPVSLMTWDETGIVSTGPGNPVTAWNNTGSTSGNNDYTILAGSIQENTRNSLAMAQGNGNSTLTCVNPSAAVAAPYTIYTCGLSFFVDVAGDYWFDSVSNVSFRPTQTDHELDAGVVLAEATAGVNNSACVFALVVDGTSSRIVGAGGVTFDLTGNAGSTSFQPETLFWDTANTANASLNGQMFETRVYSGAHDTTTINMIITELRTKWAI